MNASQVVFQIVSGVCLLLWGLNMISAGLDRAFGDDLRRFMATSTSNRVKAAAIGIAVAALLQSSTVACLIASSFAIRGVITVAGANAIMLGANVGTTIAAQIASLDVAWVAPVLMMAGYLLDKMTDADRSKYIGLAVMGLALIFISLGIVKAATPTDEMEPVKRLLLPLSNAPLLAIGVAALFTWLVHSSLGAVLVTMHSCIRVS